MKKSHRKDVIIARIIFAVLCLLLIALIALVVTLIRGRLSGSGDTQQTTQTESQQLPPVTENPDLPPVTEFPEEETEESESTDGSGDDAQEPDAPEEDVTYIWTNSGVNMRTEPNVNSSVITVLDAGTQLELLGEELGWVQVSYNGQEGYVSTDYITDTQP
jgi:uncharacterized protein YgiM (DUF1202 family)